MASHVRVFVVFALEETPAPIDVRSAALFLSREEPRWSIRGVERDSFRLGRYDQAPVTVALRSGADVLEESRVISTGLESATLPARHGLASGTARFELDWDLRRDREVAPETALLVVACAQALARLTNGVALVEGTRILNSDQAFSFGQAYSALFSGSDANGRRVSSRVHDKPRSALQRSRLHDDRRDPACV